MQVTILPNPRPSSVLEARADKIMRYAHLVFSIIAIGSGLTVAAAFVLQSIAPEQVGWEVWLRAGFYAVGGIWLITLVQKARQQAARSALVRLRVVCVLAPLGIAALVFAPDSGYPIWMKIEQAVFGILLVPLAIGLFATATRRSFRKTAERAPGSGAR